jgi:hypothetical protein
MPILYIVGTVVGILAGLVSLWKAITESTAKRELERQQLALAEQQLALEENKRSLEMCHQWRSWQWAALGVLGLVVVFLIIMPRSAA